MGFLSLVQTALLTFGPLINNAIYRWSIDNGVPSLVFFWTSLQSILSLCFVFSVGVLAK